MEDLYLRKWDFVTKNWSRPHKYGTKKVQYLKVLYWFELLKLLINEKIIIMLTNQVLIDQPKPITRGSKDENVPILNKSIKGKATFILEIWSTGECFAVVIIGTVDSFKFLIFLKLLELVLKEASEDIKALPIVVLENVPTHLSKLSKRILKNLYYEVRFYALYWPEVALVKLAFKKIKSKMKSLGGTAVINFDNDKGIA